MKIRLTLDKPTTRPLYMHTDVGTFARQNDKENVEFVFVRPVGFELDSLTVFLQPSTERYAESVSVGVGNVLTLPETAFKSNVLYVSAQFSRVADETVQTNSNIVAFYIEP